MSYFDEKCEKLDSLTNGFKPACILIAACDLDLFTWILRLGDDASEEQLAEKMGVSLRGLRSILRGVASLGFLERSAEGGWRVVDDYRDILDSRSRGSQVPWVRHAGACLRQWGQLAWSVRTGSPAPKMSSVCGPLEDYRSFIWAMDNIGRRMAPAVARKLHELGFLDFACMLDLGGATGTYAKAFLERNPSALAVVFDLPEGIEEARKSLDTSTYGDRISLKEGDFYTDEWPSGFDFVWVSAIIHQQDQSATLAMFEKAWRALLPGGRIAVRDVFFAQDTLSPPAAVFFAINMLCNTLSGMVYTVEETTQLLESAGFSNARLLISSNDMGSVIVAEKNAEETM
ncbi:MAG: methyltransferase [Planctomycetia bacterium]|nr:methyltransferase [Planctomycetia bacterium]